MAAREFRRLPEFDLGLADACKTRFGSDEEVGTGDHDAARLGVRRIEPARLAFAGKRPAETILGHPVPYGCQAERFGGTETWVLPSTSGRARRFWDVGPWQDLAGDVRGRS